jgi:hypothetical protein
MRLLAALVAPLLVHRAALPVAGLLLIVGCPSDPARDPDDEPSRATGRPPFDIVDAGPGEDPDPDPAPACVDDAQEENDVQASAVPVTGGDTVQARFCGGDDDWFAVDVDAPDCSVAVAVVTVPEDVADPSNPGDGEGTGEGEGEGEREGDGEEEDAGGSAAGFDDLDLVLVNDRGEVLGTAAGLGRRAALNARVQQAGRYAVRVRGGAHADVAYALTVGVTCGADQVCPADDIHEDNDGPASAAALDRGVPVDAAVCGADEDFWQLPVQPGCLAEVTATFSHGRGDIDLFVQARDSETERARSTSLSNEERIHVMLDDPADFVARVILFRGSDAAAGNGYRLVVDQICLGDLGCPGDDPMENNDTRAAARALGRDDATLGIVCGNDEDFFRVTPQQGCTTTFFADFVDADGDIDLELLDADGTRISGSASSDDDEEIRYAAPSNAAVVLRVFGFGDAQNRYRLTTTTTCP